MTDSSFPPPPPPQSTSLPPAPPSAPLQSAGPTGPPLLPPPAPHANPVPTNDTPSTPWWKRKAWILPVWAWIVAGVLGVGVIASAFGESEDDADGPSAAALPNGDAVATETSRAATEESVAPTTNAPTTTEATTTTASTTTTSVPDYGADVVRWSVYALDASEVSAGVITQIGDIATAAGSDTLGWIRGDYADVAIDAWFEATTMLEDWNERPQPVPEQVARCDILATQMFEATLDIADVFSDMAIEGSTDIALLEQVGADMGALGELAEENTACIELL